MRVVNDLHWVFMCEDVSIPDTRKVVVNHTPWSLSKAQEAYFRGGA